MVNMDFSKNPANPELAAAILSQQEREVVGQAISRYVINAASGVFSMRLEDAYALVYYLRMTKPGDSIIEGNDNQFKLLATCLAEATRDLPVEEATIASKCRDDIEGHLFERQCDSVRLVIPEILPEDFS